MDIKNYLRSNDSFMHTLPLLCSYKYQTKIVQKKLLIKAIHFCLYFTYKLTKYNKNVLKTFNGSKFLVQTVPSFKLSLFPSL